MSNFQNRENFNRARARALRHDFLARLSGKPTSLLPFDALSTLLRGYQQVPLAKTEMIPLDKIVGSVGRYKDFTREFLPKHSTMKDRWARVEQAMDSLEGTPPIEVYRVGGVYFVADGNHRVSVARASGLDALEAHVTDIPVAVNLEPGDSLDEAITKAERARFLAETGLAERVPVIDIYFTRPGGFARLLEHIQIHGRLLSQDRGSEVAFEDAAADWYHASYVPTIEAMRDRQLLRRFPGRTAADLYVWLWGNILEAHRQFGEKIDPLAAVEMLEERAPSAFQQAVHGLMVRIADISRAFVSGDEYVPDWATQAFEWGDGSLSELAETARETEVDN